MKLGYLLFLCRVVETFDDAVVCASFFVENEFFKCKVRWSSFCLRFDKRYNAFLWVWKKSFDAVLARFAVWYSLLADDGVVSMVCVFPRHCGGPVNCKMSSSVSWRLRSFTLVYCVLVYLRGLTRSEGRVMGLDGWFLSVMKRLYLSA
jgi:hypothetical protein